MVLKNLSIVNFKNIKSADISLSPKLNCFFGMNGMGKTNLLDAIYYLSFCKSAINHIDNQLINHDEEFFAITGKYEDDNGGNTSISCGLKRKHKKVFKRDGKAYKRFSEHIGHIPLVIISPSDNYMISGGSEERRKFMDMVISQYDGEYLNALIRYDKALMQRNAMLKSETLHKTPEYEIWEEMMDIHARIVHGKRSQFIEEFMAYFNEIYQCISAKRENVSLAYKSHCSSGNLKQMLEESRERDKIIGFTTKGVHKDDIEMALGGYAIKREGSQGQNKTFVIALKLAQFIYLDQKGNNKPLLLLDDLFDKLDNSRVEQIIKLVAGKDFGQIIITDTDKSRFNPILGQVDNDYKIFNVTSGCIEPESAANGGAAQA